MVNACWAVQAIQVTTMGTKMKRTRKVRTIQEGRGDRRERETHRRSKIESETKALAITK